MSFNFDIQVLLERYEKIEILLRNCHYGFYVGAQVFAPVMKHLFLQAIVWSHYWDNLSPSTQSEYRSRLERQLTEALDFSVHFFWINVRSGLPDSGLARFFGRTS